jgi:hypothetical protein
MMGIIIYFIVGLNMGFCLGYLTVAVNIIWAILHGGSATLLLMTMGQWKKQGER